MRAPLGVIVQGLGPIGARILAAAHEDPALAVLGAVDVAPALVGRSAREATGGGPDGVLVRATLAEARAAAPGAVAVLHATGSRFGDVAPQLHDAVALGLHVVSTCEELACPFARHAEAAAALDARARAARCTVVGVGVNPGLVMDRLPALLACASLGVRAVRVVRALDPRSRRVPFQRKVGYGLGRTEAERLVAAGAIGHVGLRESAELCARALGWRLGAARERLALVQPDAGGPVIGVVQTLDVAAHEGGRIELRFEAHAGVTSPHDTVEIDGRSPIRLRIDGGLAGEDMTVGAVLGAARAMARAPRGLVTVLDLPLGG
jgi:4-hydroxy-tetrahydrodipicolinate reductase